jgi:hypothetical protein
MFFKLFFMPEGGADGAQLSDLTASVAPAAGSAVTFLEGKHCMFSYQWDVSSQAICQLLL